MRMEMVLPMVLQMEFKLELEKSKWMNRFDELLAWGKRYSFLFLDGQWIFLVSCFRFYCISKTVLLLLSLPSSCLSFEQSTEERFRDPDLSTKEGSSLRAVTSFYHFFSVILMDSRLGHPWSNSTSRTPKPGWNEVDPPALVTYCSSLTLCCVLSWMFCSVWMEVCLEEMKESFERKGRRSRTAMGSIRREEVI